MCKLIEVVCKIIHNVIYTKQLTAVRTDQDATKNVDFSKNQLLSF